MSWNFIDLDAPNKVWRDRPLNERPRGVLPPPPVVLERIEMDKAKCSVPWGPEYEARIREDLTLWFYYEHVYIAYRSTPAGPEVLAAGDEVESLLGSLSAEQRRTIILEIP